MTSVSKRPDVRPRPTMRDVAALAGVGIKTVSRVLNDEPNVSASTAGRVMTAAQALNYRLDMQAGNLRRIGRKTGTIGVVVGNVANPHSGGILRAIENVAIQRGYAVFAASLDEDPERELSLAGELVKRRTDGLLLTAISSSQAFLIPEQQHGTPMVFLDREPVGLEADAVVCDNLVGSAKATAHLIAHGHRRIAILCDRQVIQTARLRKQGFLDEIAKAGIATAETTVIEEVPDAQTSYRAVLAMLDDAHPPTAIFAAQNLITVGAIRALRERGQHHTVAIVGFDDVILGDLLEPAVTVIAQHLEAMGTAAADRLFSRIDGYRGPPAVTFVPTTLIARGSGEIRPGR